jgi:hypothetical protein
VFHPQNHSCTPQFRTARDLQLSDSSATGKIHFGRKEPYLSSFLDSISSRLQSYYHRQLGTQKIHEIIEHLDASLASMSRDLPNHIAMRRNLACLLLLFPEVHRGRRIEEAFEVFREICCDCPMSPAKFRHNTAIFWATFARAHRHSTLLQAHILSVHLLNPCLYMTPGLEDQVAFLSDIPPMLPSNAAAAAISAGQLDIAVEVLEEGRTTLWSRLSGFRDALHDLGVAYPVRARKFEKLTKRVEYLTEAAQDSLALPHNDHSLDLCLKQHRHLMMERDRWISEIRQLPGFSQFLQVKPYSQLRAAADEGPMIIVNISEFRSDALIVLADRAMPLLVPLPHATFDHLQTLRDRLIVALRLNMTQEYDSDPEFKLILTSVWHCIVRPIVEVLLENGIKRKSRIWWCPTSIACTLPLHAAGDYIGGGEILPDIFISSYNSSLAGIIKARLPHSGTPNNGLLVVKNPDGSLPFADDEAAEIQRYGDSVHALSGKQATRHTILTGLHQNSWVHFASHARQRSRPFLSAFKLRKDYLPLLDIVDASLPDAEFAYLSACETAIGGKGSNDEVIHFASAFQFAGFRSVVGTLWSIRDEDGPKVAKRFYKHVFRNGMQNRDFRETAKALHIATRKMRKQGKPLCRWIAFVHIGA